MTSLYDITYPISEQSTKWCADLASVNGNMEWISSKSCSGKSSEKFKLTHPLQSPKTLVESFAVILMNIVQNTKPLFYVKITIFKNEGYDQRNGHEQSSYHVT